MDNRELKVKSSKVFTGIFGGSAPFGYQPTDHLETGVGSSLFHSITRMPQYQHFSNEELRMEDYNASGGIFGATIKKLANAICNPPKRTPFCYGNLIKEAIRSVTATHQEVSTAASPPAVPVEVAFSAKNPFRKSDLKFEGKHQNVTVLVESGSVVNFSFSGDVHLAIRSADSNPSSFKPKARSKSRGQSKTHRKPSKHGKGKTEKK